MIGRDGVSWYFPNLELAKLGSTQNVLPPMARRITRSFQNRKVQNGVAQSTQMDDAAVSRARTTYGGTILEPGVVPRRQGGHPGETQVAGIDNVASRRGCPWTHK